MIPSHPHSSSSEFAVSEADLERLVATGLIAGAECHLEIGSTNDRACELVARPNLACPFLVFAGSQTAGRGRGAHRWWSGPGALTFSLVVEPERGVLDVDRWPLVALAAGVAACITIERFLPGASIGLKWPNDVFLAGKKVSGILVESPSPRTGRLVVGLGMNINNCFANAPEEVQQSATSLKAMAGRPFGLPDVLSALIAEIGSSMDILARSQAALIERWRSYCFLTGKRVRFIEAGSREVRGLCQGIDADGRLILATEKGIERHVTGAIVRWD
jgi:BirA family biotin operon repressor/biotin-[acetyl-CoA-carboxylase] ligase